MSAEPRSLRLVDELFEPIDETDPNAERKREQQAAERKVLTKYVGAITRKGRERERAEIEQALGVQTLEELGMLPAVQSQFDAAMQRVNYAHEEQIQRERSRERHAGIFQGATFALAIGTAFGAVLGVAASQFSMNESFNAAGELQEKAAFTAAATARGQ